MRIIRAAEFREQPWKNGGGTTIEIAAFPPGSGLDSFDWRISMARVERPSPFSLFPGVDRTIAVLEGAGLALHIKDRGIVRLNRASPAYSFCGDLAVESTLAAGPVLDLNVMSRRGCWRHSLFHVTAISAFRLVRLGFVTLALIRGAPARLGAEAEELRDGDALLLNERAPRNSVDFVFDGTADIYIVDLWPLPAGA